MTPSLPPDRVRSPPKGALPDEEEETSLVRRRWTTGAVLLSLTHSLSGANHVWSGAVDGTWSNPANWSSGGAPGMGEPSLTLAFPLNPVTYVTTNDVGSIALSGLTISDNGYTIGGAATIAVDGPVMVDALGPSLVTV